MKRYFLRSMATTRTLPKYITSETTSILERIGNEVCNEKPLVPRQQWKKRKHNQRAAFNRSQKPKVHQTRAHRSRKTRSDKFVADSRDSSSRVEGVSLTPAKKRRQECNILEPETEVSRVIKSSVPRDLNPAKPPTPKVGNNGEESEEGSEENARKGQENEERSIKYHGTLKTSFSTVSRMEACPMGPKVSSQVGDHMFLTPKPIRKNMSKHSGDENQPSIEYPGAGIWGPSPKPELHWQSSGYALLNISNTPLPNLMLTPNLTFKGCVLPTPNIARTPSSLQLAMSSFSPRLCIGNLETPALFPHHQDSGVPDILEMIDDDSSTLQAFDKSLSAFDTVELSDNSVADYILTLCADYKKCPSSGSMDHRADQFVSQQYDTGSRKKGRYGKRMTAELEKAVREDQRQRNAQRRLERILKQRLTETEDEEEDNLKVRPLTRSFARAQQHTDAENPGGYLEIVCNKGHTEE